MRTSRACDSRPNQPRVRGSNAATRFLPLSMLHSTSRLLPRPTLVWPVPQLLRLAAVWLLCMNPWTASALDLPKGVLPESVRAQVSSLGASAAATASKPSAGTQAPSEAWSSRLEVARAKHQKLQLLSNDSEPLLYERKLASARRLMLLSAQSQASMEQNLENAAAPAVPEIKPIAGEAPYSMLEVDALRDQLDALRVRQSAMKMQDKSMDAEVEAAVEARIAADASLRRRQDGFSQLRSADAQAKAAAQLELSQIQAEVADLEVLQADQERARARAGAAALVQPIAQLEAEIGRVSPHQTLREHELDRLIKDFGREKDRAMAERIKLEAQIGRLQATDKSSTSAESSRIELESLSMALSAYRELESMVREKTSLWRARQAPWLAGDDPAKKQAAAENLNRGFALLQGRLQIASRQADFLRAELRSQEARVQDMSPEDPQRTAQLRILAAFQTQLNAQDRLIETLLRGQVLLARSREDMGLGQSPSDAKSWLKQLADWSANSAVYLWNYELFSATENTQIDGRVVTIDYGVTVGKSLGILIMLVAGYGVARWLSHRLIHHLARRLHLSSALARVLRRWLNSILLLVVLMLVLKLARIPITAFAFLGGALAIGVGFGAQNVIKNLISGIIILFERKIRVGDIVSVGGISGTVQTVDLRATTVRGFDGIDAIVPNSTLLENQVSNWNGSSPEVRRAIVVGVAYGSDVRHATKLIADCAAAHPSVLKEPPLEVFFDDFAADALSLRLQFWFRLDGPRSGIGIDSDLRFAINDALATAGIAIAFPQRDVHLDMAMPLQVELRRKPSETGS
jgi:potassium efflux system protein